MQKLLAEVELPEPSPELILLCATWVVFLAPLNKKARERAKKRIRVLLDPAVANVIRIRGPDQARAVERAGRMAGAYWGALEPKLDQLIKLMEP